MKVLSAVAKSSFMPRITSMAMASSRTAKPLSTLHSLNANGTPTSVTKPQFQKCGKAARLAQERTNLIKLVAKFHQVPGQCGYRSKSLDKLAFHAKAASSVAVREDAVLEIPFGATTKKESPKKTLGQPTASNNFVWETPVATPTPASLRTE